MTNTGVASTSSHDGEQPACVHVRVHGRVQGVGYRDFAVAAANQSGCRGFVRNARDRATVELQAEGTRHSLESLLKELQRGPILARVERLDVIWDEATNAFDGFVVRR